MGEAIITYFGLDAKVACDLKCEKAWGLNSRPYKQLSEDEDDKMWYADDELGIAPIDPETYEGSDAKPLSPKDFPNKWCVRECERCEMSKPYEHHKPLQLENWSKRVYNMKRRW